MSSERLHSITVARFVAAFAVLVFHVIPRWIPNFPSEIPTFLEKLTLTGYGFVSFFYILSGFVIQYTYGGPPLKTKLFWRKRFARLAPVFYFSLLLGILPALPVLKAEGELLWLPFYLFVSVFFVGSFFPGCQVLNYPSWSIHVEAFFYFFYPWIHKLQSFKKGSFFQLIFALIMFNWVLIFWGLYSYPELLSWNGINQGKPSLEGNAKWISQFLHTNPISHFSEFLLGIALGKLHLDGFRISGSFSKILLGLSATLFCVFVDYAPSVPYLLVNSVALSPIFLLAILGLANLNWNPPNFLILLGEASYSLYILT